MASPAEFDTIGQFFENIRVSPTSKRHVLRGILFTRKDGKHVRTVGVIRVGPDLSAGAANDLARKVSDDPSLIVTHPQIEDWRGRDDLPTFSTK